MLSNFLSDMLDFAKTAKAWWAGVVTAVGQFVVLWQVASSDSAISLDEAQGLYLMGTQVVTTILGIFAVWKARNKVTASDPNVRKL